MIALFEKIENKKNEIQNIKKKELKALRKELFDYIKEKYLPAFDMNLKYGYLFSGKLYNLICLVTWNCCNNPSKYWILSLYQVSLFFDGFETNNSRKF